MARHIFLSHGSLDVRVAIVLAETLSRISLRQIKVWYSSDPSPAGGLRPGQLWADEIKSQLLASEAILVVLTRNSMYRPWLYFESGYVSSQGCQVIPLCFGISPPDVPLPLAMFQCYELNNYRLLMHFCKKFFEQLQISFDEEMAAPILRCAAKSLKSLIPHSTENAGQRDGCACKSGDRVEGCLAMLRDMFDDLPVPVHSIDETGVICNVNKRWLEALGYQRDEVIGKPADFLMTSESAKLAMLVVIPSFWKTGFCQDVPYQYKKRDGTLIDVLLNCYATTDTAGKKISLSFVTVVSSQKGLRELREESLARYGQRLRAEQTGFFETDLFGNFMTINNYMSQLLGFTNEEEVVGKNFREVVDPEAAKSVFNAFNSVFTNRTLKGSYIWSIQKGNRNGITVESKISLITLPNGEATGFRGSVRKL